MKFKEYLNKKGITTSAFERKPHEVQTQLRNEYEELSGTPAPKPKPHYRNNEAKRQRIRARGRADKALLRSTGAETEVFDLEDDENNDN